MKHHTKITKKEGITKAYYPSGNLLVEEPYKNDKAEGRQKGYYEMDI